MTIDELSTVQGAEDAFQGGVPLHFVQGSRINSLLLASWRHRNPAVSKLLGHKSVQSFRGGDPAIDWSEVPLSDANRRRFWRNWWLTQEIWEDEDHAFWAGEWFGSDTGYTFEPYEASRLPPADAMLPWDELLFGARLYFVDLASDRLTYYRSAEKVSADAVRSRVPPVIVEGRLVHIDERDHTDSVVYLAESAHSAGVASPASALLAGKDQDEVHPLWTEEQRLEVIREHSLALNAAQSTGKELEASLKARIKALPAISGPAEATEDQRKTQLSAWEAKYSELNSASKPNAVDKFFAARADRYRSLDYLPDDTDALRALLIERLGVACNAARNLVLDVAANQDAYGDGACVEERRALEDIAGIRRGGNRRLREAATAEAMDAEYTKLARLLAAIPVTNAPLWLTPDGNPLVPDLNGYVDLPITRAADGTVTASFAALVQNPPSVDLKDGRLPKDLGSPYCYPDRGVRGWVIDTAAADAANDQRRAITIRWAGTGNPPLGKVVPIIARNNCGPTVRRFRPVEPPAPAGD